MSNKELCWVFGAFGHLGQAVCNQLSQHNVDIVRVGRSSNNDIQIDLSSEKKIQEMLLGLYEKHIPDRVFFCQRYRPTADDIDHLDFLNFINAEVNPLVALSKIFSDKKNQKPIRCIHFSSNAGIRFDPNVGLDYCASKSIAIALTKILAAYTKNFYVTWNCITFSEYLKFPLEDYPDIRKKELVAYAKHMIYGENLSADELAKYAIFLTSKSNSHITGQVINVDGGAHYDLYESMIKN